MTGAIAVADKNRRSVVLYLENLEHLEEFRRSTHSALALEHRHVQSHGKG